MVFPDGSKHLLRVVGEDDPGQDGYYVYGPDGRRSQYCEEATYSGVPTRVYYTTDGTFARLEVQQDYGTPDTNHLNNPWTLYLKDGTRVYGGNSPQGGHRPQSICDRNANCVSVEYTSGDDLSFVSSITDEHNRQIAIANGGPYHSPTSDVITATGYGQAALSWTVDWAFGTDTPRGYFCGNTLCTLRPYQGWNVAEIHLPAATGLLPYTFEYNARFGELSEVGLPSGATVNYTYALDPEELPLPQWDRLLANYPTQKVVSYTDEFTGGAAPSETSRLELTQNPAGKYISSTFTGPDGGATVTHFVQYDYQGPGTWDSGLITQIDHPDGSVTGKTWDWIANTPPSSFTYDNRNAYVSEETFAPSGGASSSRSYTQDRNGNTTFVTENDWNPPGGLLRYTTTTFFLGTSGDPGGTNADGYWNTGVGCTGSSCILNLPKSTSVAYPNTAREEFCYDGAGNLTLHARLKEGGSATPLVANCSTGSLTSAAIGSKYTYGAHGNLLTATDPREVRTRYQYDGSDLYVTDKYEAEGTDVQRHWRYTTDFSSGKVQTITDADNSVSTTTDYDAFGRPTSVTDPAKIAITTYNDAARYKRTTTTGDGLTLDGVEYYDQLGRVVLTRRSENGEFSSIGSVQTDYNQTGNGIKVERRFENLASGRYEYISNPYRDRSGDATRGVTRREYDAAGRLVEEAAFSGSYPVSEQNRTGTSTIGYSGPSRTVTDPAGKARTLTVDALGRLVKVVEAPLSENYITSYTYSGQNNLASVTQGTQTRTFVYDPLGRLTSATNPESGLTGYTYDDNGNLLTKTDASNKVTCFGILTGTTCDSSGYKGYDALNRVKKKTYSDATPEVTYGYDTCAFGRGRLCSVGNGVSTTNYTAYDALGRVTAGNQNTGGTAYSFGYGYNALGLTSITYPSGRKVTFDYDGAGRPSKVGLNTVGTTDYVSSVSYTPHGAVSSLSLHNEVVETALYNSRLQPYLLEAVKSGTPSISLWKQENFYCTGEAGSCTSNNGNVISQKLTAPKTGGGTLVLSTAYGAYDGANRITSAAETGAGTPWSQSYGYGNNQFGNLSIAGDGDAQSLRCGSYDAEKNRCNASGFVYDNAGNLTTYQGRTLGYDAEGRQTSLSDGGSYEYDGEGRRVKKVAEGLTTVYVYDAMGRLAAEYASAAPTNQPDCATCYLTVDHLGSTRLVTDAEGAVKRRTDYHPFGWEINPGYGDRNSVTGYAATDEFNPKFTGKERDYESGLRLDYFGARYYAGAQGRFTSPDPLMNSGRPWIPQSWNRYAYALNNPLRYTDPTGLYEWDKSCGRDDLACEQNRQQFRDALAAMREAANNLKERSEERQELEAVLDKYGDEGEKNKVYIAFGAAGGYLAEQSTSFFTRSNKITFDMKMINGTLDRNQKISPLYSPKVGLAEMVTHEGSHMLDKFFFGNPVTRKGSYRTEFNAFNTQSYVPMALKAYSAYGLWNPSWAAADKETFRSKAVQKITEDHVREMWDKKK